MPEFNTWFPTSRHGSAVLNAMDFGAIGNGLSNSMSFLGYTSPENARNGTGGNGIPYPECTDLNDTADWCAIQAMFTAGMTTDGDPHLTNSYLNKPMYIPNGRYVTRKPLVLPPVQGAVIYGDGAGTQIGNETATAPDNTCITMNGFTFARFQDIGFVASGEGSIAFDMYWDQIVPCSLSGHLFINCRFSAPAGIGCYIGRGNMASEMTFIGCYAQNCVTGYVIGNANALNYTFVGGGASECSNAGIQINAGGNLVVLCGSYANNGWDIKNLTSGTYFVCGTRTESANFIYGGGGNWSIFGCNQTWGASPSVFLDCAWRANISACLSYTGKITNVGGHGTVTIDSSDFNSFHQAAISAAANNGSGLIRITHSAHSVPPYEWFEDGQEVLIQYVVGTVPANGVWIIDKISGTQVDLIGSAFSGSYTSGGIIGPGPNNHLKGFLGRTEKTSSRDLCETHTVNHTLVHSFSGTQYDNKGATAEVVFTLPYLMVPEDNKGSRFSFCVYAAQNLKIVPEGSITTTIYDGTATGTTYLQSNTVGSTVELVLMDGAGFPSEETPTTARWYVKSKTGTWTLT